MTTALMCKQCAAPLPAPAGGSPFVVCTYCGTTHTVTSTPMELDPRAPGPTDADRRRTEAPLAWDVARANSKDPVVAVRAVVAVYSGQLRDEREAERAARLAESLLKGFDAKHGTETLFDKTAVVRIAEAAVGAVMQLRSKVLTDTEINLPFFTATDAGPLHLLHAMTRKDLEELDKMGAFQVQAMEATEAEQATARRDVVNSAVVEGALDEAPRRSALVPVLTAAAVLAAGLAVFFLLR